MNLFMQTRNEEQQQRRIIVKDRNSQKDNTFNGTERNCMVRNYSIQ